MASKLCEVLLGRYELEDTLGVGGMSTVYRAHDRVLERPVAVKVLHTRLGADAESVRRFRGEARAVARLSHPNIIAVLDRGVSDGREFIVLELVEGDDLRRVLDRDGRLPVARALAVVLDVAAGLAYAHDNGFVHRDVKPQNILVTPDGAAKLVDFGIARAARGGSAETLTGTLLGTSAYISPEQAQGQQVTPASDVYSLGVVLYELLTGSVPYVGESFLIVAMKHVNEPPPRLSDRPDIPPRLARAVERALAKLPEERFASMDAFAAELEQCRRQVEACGDHGSRAASPRRAVVETSTATVPPALSHQSRSRTRRRGAHALAGVGLVAAVALAAGATFVAIGTNGRPSVSAGGPPARAASGASLADGTVALRGVGDYTPSGPADAHADTAALATDGDGPGWQTQTYATPAFGRLLPGLGLVLDAGRFVRLTRLTIRTPTPGFVARVLAGDARDGGFQGDSAARVVTSSASFGLAGRRARYYVVWITRLPPGDRAVVTDVTARS